MSKLSYPGHGEDWKHAVTEKEGVAHEKSEEEHKAKMKAMTQFLKTRRRDDTPAEKKLFLEVQEELLHEADIYPPKHE